MDDDLRGRALRGIGWIAAEKWGVRLVSLGVFIILTRTVAPEAFGLVSMTSVITTLLLVFVDAGFQKSLIQRQQITVEDTSTAFWSSLVIGTLIYAGVYLTAPLLEIAFSMPGLSSVLRVAAISIVVSALAGVPVALLEREMLFRKLAIRNIVGTLAGAAVAVPMALSGMGVWALVFQTLVTSSVAAVTLWLTTSWRPKFVYSASSLRALWKFGVSVLGIELLNKLQDNLDKLVVGAVFGEHSLGLYYVAQRLVLIVTELITTVIAKLSLTTFSRLQSDTERFGRVFNQLTFASGVIAVPIFGVMALFAETLIRFVSGENWGAAAPLMQLLSVASAFAAILYFDKNALLAVGQSGRAFGLAAVEMCLTIVLTIVAVPLGLVAFAAIRIVRLFAVWPYRQWLLVKYANVRVLPYLRNVATLFACFAPSFFVFAILNQTPWSTASPVLWAYVVPVSVLMIITYYLVLWFACGRENRQVIRRTFNKLRP